MIAPTTGPSIVPRPPTSAINMTIPDVLQCTSDRVAKPSTTVLVEPANPASAADSTNASSLIFVDVVAQRNGARFVFLIAFSTWPNGEWIVR